MIAIVLLFALIAVGAWAAVKYVEAGNIERVARERQDSDSQPGAAQ